MNCKQTSELYFVRQLSFLFILFSSLLLIQPAFAVSMSQLYESTIRVDSTDSKKEKTEKQLIAEAFTSVLIKVSGRSDVSSSTAYSAMLKKAEGAISQFRYDNRTIATASDEASESSEEQKEEKEKWFWVRFNAKAINDLLNEAQIPIWGKVRPETLIWFSQEIKGKRQMQSQHDEPEIYAVFKRQAEQRGISLIFPFMDLQDQSSISATDIWGNFNDAILLASKRYQAQSTLTSRLFKDPSGLWVSQWNLLMLGEVQSWEIRDEKLEQVLAAGINELTDKLSRQFTQVVREDDDSGVLVQINNVGDFRAFQEVDDYLRNLATVKSISLMQTEQDKVMYSINYLSSKNSLIQEIRLGDLLNSVERSRVDNDQYSNANADSNYKPVILDDLDKKNSGQDQSTPQLSDREKALNSLEQSQENSQNKSQVTDGKATTTQMVEEKPVDILIPELEYWYAK
ncbi:MAG: DUF2066 domain-containing protein [Gammaproteobacteria bacterium]|nr:DUF2066 domain-containing protein [Gammaproteobacteria bacterium]